MHIIKPILHLIAEYAAGYKLRDWIPLDKIDWFWLSLNPNDGAIALLKANQDKIDWEWLSGNPNNEAITLLKANQDKIDWSWLSRNPNDGAIALLKANQDKIDWEWLSFNPNDEAIALLKAELTLNSIYVNPNIFVLTTEAIYANLLKLAN
jgi:hypothetical protein